MKALVQLIALHLVLTAAQAQIASVNWGAQNSNGLGTADGTELALGDLVRIGTFNLADTEIRAAQSNPALLNSAFVEYATAAIGDDVGVTAHWNTVTSRSTDSLGLVGRKIYLWAFDTPSMVTATQQGIFTSSKSNWIFPKDSAIPNTTIIDLEEVELSGILIGAFGVGNSAATGDPLFNLTVVPEPEDYAVLFGFASIVVVAILRLQKKARTLN